MALVDAQGMGPKPQRADCDQSKNLPRSHSVKESTPGRKPAQMHRREGAGTSQEFRSV
ncbi:jg7142, partial [Pararge aegeria aegeria]